jgi:hypothetical protein
MPTKSYLTRNLFLKKNIVIQNFLKVQYLMCIFWGSVIAEVVNCEPREVKARAQRTQPRCTESKTWHPIFTLLHHSKKVFIEHLSIENENSTMVKTLSVIIFCIIVSLLHAFSIGPSISRQRIAAPLKMSSDVFELEISIPPSNSGLLAQMKINPVLEGGSEIIQVRYKIPFGLNVEPKNGFATVTQDGQGGEKVGDVLRFTSQWTMGLPRGNGLISTAASFSGGIGWQCSLFDVMKAKRWEEVVEALVSNVPQRTDEVVLIFERKINNNSD